MVMQWGVPISVPAVALADGALLIEVAHVVLPEYPVDIECFLAELILLHEGDQS